MPGGTLTIAGLTDGGMSIGSVEGAGAIVLGANTLTEGSLNVSTTFSGTISGSGGLVKTGSGTLTLTGANGYTGGTTISGGAIQLGNGGTTGSITGDVADSGALAFNRSDAVTFAGAISGTGGVVQAGSGTTILTGANTYGGGTLIGAGTLQIGTGGTAGSITGDIVDNGTLAFDRSDTTTFGGAISGTGAVSQIGSGTTVLTGANSYGGTTMIAAGTLQVGAGGTMGALGGGAVADDGVLAFDRSDTIVVANAISGSGALAQNGGGVVILTADDTYMGGTTVAAGALVLGANGTAGAIAGNVTDNAIFAVNRSDTYTFGGTISGTGMFVQAGAGTTILTGADSYAGGTAVQAGTLQLGAGGTTGAIVGDVADAGVLVFDRSDSVTFAGAIGGSGAVAQIGSGTTVLTGAGTYTGGTTIASGTLQLGTGGTAGSIVGDVADNGTLAFDRSDAVLFDGAISGSGALLQSGAGVTVLTAADTYTGGTTIAAGDAADRQCGHHGLHRRQCRRCGDAGVQPLGCAELRGRDLGHRHREPARRRHDDAERRVDL
ncbi:MAG: autotransporter-associated beta strand repeat-containing protein [Rhizomicrobium sp.]